MNTLQDTYEKLVSELSPKAQNVLKKNNLTQVKSIELWFLGVKHDFPCDDTEIQHELESMLRKLREYTLKLSFSIDGETGVEDTTDSEEEEVRTPVDRNQQKYDNLLNQNKKAKEFAEKNGLLNVKNIYNVPNKKTREYDEFIKVRELYKKWLDSPNDTEASALSFILSEEDNNFIIEYQTINGHIPMFFLLDRYLKQSVRREDMVIVSHYGIKDGIPKTVGELAEEYGVSDQTIRNWLSVRTGWLGHILSRDDWNEYPIVSSPCFLDTDEDVTKIADNENVLSESIVCAMVLREYKYCYLYKDKNTFRKSTDYPEGVTDVLTMVYLGKYDEFRIQDAMRRIEVFSNAGQELDDRVYLINEKFIKRYFSEESWPNLTEDERNTLVSLFIRIMCHFMSDYVNGNGTLNSINYVEEICAILRDNGTLKYNKIAQKLSEKYPDSIYNNENDNNNKRLKYLIDKNKQTIFHIHGKTGKISLANGINEDDDNYIYQMIERLLEENDSPMLIDNIKNVILAMDKTANSNNIKAACRNNRFQHLVGINDNKSYYWFAERDYGQDLFRPYQKEEPESFDELFERLKNYCEKNGIIPISQTDSKLYNFYRACDLTCEFYDENKRFPEREEINIRCYNQIKTAFEQSGIDKLREVVEFVKQYRRR